MIKTILKRFLSLALCFLMVCTLLPVTAYADTTLTTAVKDLGVAYTEGETIEWSLEGGNIVGSVKATTGCSTSAASTTLTLTNKKATDAILSFDYEVSITGGTITLDGTGVTAGSSFQKTVTAGDTVKIELTSSATANQITKITLKNILLYDPAATANVTFVPASDGGSYTVDGETITASVTKQNTAAHDYQMVATPAEGYRFYGWVSDGTVISSNANTVMHLDIDQTITAMFVDKTLPTFAVDGTEFFDLNEAVTYAQSNSKDTVVLVGDGTLRAGTYTIPAGITLLIPFDAKYTLYTTEPGYVKTVETQAAFRTLTMADGAVLQVNGAVSVGGKCYTSSSTAVCKPTGAYGHVKMAEGSVIHVNSGAVLYAWGYVTGSGNVYAHSGANVYEFFQVTDWRGGSVTSAMQDNDNKVFPFSQYYVQNVEAPLTFENGANETIRITVTAGGVSASAEVSFMGETGMFQLEDGSTVTKRYEPATDRMIFDMNGSAKLNGIAMNDLPVIGDFNSNVYVLPINNNMTMNVHSGTMTLNQDTALQPGAKVVVDAGAELAVVDGMSLYVYDDAQWSKNYVWGSGDKGITQVAYSPSGRGSRTILDAVIDVNGTLVVNGAIYTTEGGADICSSQGTGVYIQQNAPGTSTVTYQYDQNAKKYIEIPITAAKLHNADGTYTPSAQVKAGTTIHYQDGKWVLSDADLKHITLTFNSNPFNDKISVTGSMASQDMVAASNTALTPNAFTYDGHTFAGWNTKADGSGTGYVDGAQVDLNEDTILYAQWTHNADRVVTDEAVEPTCTKTGLTAGTHCGACGEVLVAQEVIEATGHTEVIDVAVEATCTEPGKTEGKHCSVCNEVLVAQEEIPAKGHSWGDGEVTTAPTCENAGVKTFTCSVCSETKTEAIDATGHTSVDVAEQPATCTEAGHTAGTKCSVCGATISGLEVIPAKGHAEVIDVAVEATCTEPGKTEGKHCSVCNEVLVAQEVIPAKGHTEVVDPAVEATCTADGKTEGKHCSVCNEVLVAQEVVPAKGHTEVIDAAKEATCTETGLTEGKHCSACDAIIVAQTEIPAKGHTEVIDVAKEATCTETGLTEGKHCSVCNEVLTAQEVVPAKGHTEEIRNTKDATLTEDGYTGDTYCSVCNEKLHDGEVIPKTGVAITWNVDGVKTTEVYKKGATPSHEDTFETPYYTYTITGWTPEITEAEEDATYTATFVKTGKNGLCIVGDDTYWLNDGEIVLNKGLTQVKDEAGHNLYYYFGEDGKAVKNILPDQGNGIDYWVEKTNDLLPRWGYYFDENGVILHDEKFQKGITDVDGKLYYYIDGIRVHMGMFRIGQDYYYAKSNGELVVSGSYYCVRTNDLKAEGTYTFDAEGKMVMPDVTKNGIFAEDDSLYYYVEGERTYAGLIEIDGSYYYVKTSGEVVHGCKYWITKTNGLMTEKSYEFGDDGKMVIPDVTKNGIVAEDGSLYYYVNGERTYAGLIEIGGSYYYVKTNGEVVHGRSYWITKTNGLMGERSYTFADDGKMLDPQIKQDNAKKGIVAEDGSLYYYVDGVRTYAGLIQIDGSYYYVKTSGEVVHGRKYWISKTNGLLKEGSYTFADDGKMMP